MRIDIEDLHYRYPSGVEALKGVNLAIELGEHVGIIGQNGSGKTTLAKHLNGLLKPTRGKVVIGNWDTQQHTVARMASRVGYVFQNPDEQLFTKSVQEEVSFGPKNLGYDENRRTKLVDEALSITELSDKRDINPYDLSPTWRKMVTLASIIAMDTPIIVFDEPTTGQDATSISRIAHVVRTLKEQQKTLITITHDIDFCAQNFDRVVALADGKVLLDGPKEEVFSQGKILEKTFVEPPQLTRLGAELKLGKTVTDIDSFLSLLQQATER